jgi:hypothetical protein
VKWSRVTWNNHPKSRVRAHMPIEFLHGLPLGPEELQIVRGQIEEGFDVTLKPPFGSRDFRRNSGGPRREI